MGTATISPERKVAILVAMLGDDACTEVFRHLSKREVAKVAREVADLGSVEPDLGLEIIEEYYLRAIKSPPTKGGSEMARRILSGSSISEDLVDQLIQSPTQSDEVLGPLLEAPPEVLAQALEHEHPQTTALVLLHLPTRRAGQLLSSLRDDRRGETVLRMANVREVDEGILESVAECLRESLIDTSGSSEDQDGFQRTADVLGTLPRADSKRLLEELEPDHPEPVEALRNRLYTFESLVQADNRGMQELLRGVDSSKTAVALVGAGEDLLNRFLGNLSERAADRLREEIELSERASESERAEAEKEILAAALQLESDGKLIFESPGE